jgi:hypothetical protein
MRPSLSFCGQKIKARVGIFVLINGNYGKSANFPATNPRAALKGVEPPSFVFEVGVWITRMGYIPESACTMYYFSFETRRMHCAGDSFDACKIPDVFPCGDGVCGKDTIIFAFDKSNGDPSLPL